MGTGNLQSSDRILKRALEYVSDYWLPLDRELVDRIREGVRSGRYDTDRILLREEICADTGLFFGCIRELQAILSQQGNSLNDYADLTEVIEAIDLEFLQLALESVAEAPSVHILSEGDEGQLTRMLEAMISAAGAASMAPAFGEHPGRARSLAALRQLGFALVAWNYPTVYQSALESAMEDSEKLEDAITSRLGFSPLLLASRLAKSWGLSQELVEATLIPTMPLYEEAHIISASHDTLSMICRVSESLARAQFDTLYPTARDDWDAAIDVVGKHIGEEGIEKIRRECAEACRYVLASCPDIFRPGLLLDEEKLQAVQPRHASRNPYIDLCSESLRSQLDVLYNQYIKPSRPSERALRYLMRDVVQAAEFSGGCVFTIDPVMGNLIPQLEMGSVDLRTGEPVSLLDDGLADDPVPMAFTATDGGDPVIVEYPREQLCSISCAFGRSQRLGVFYLELPLGGLRERHDQTLTDFRALSFALVDCLGL